MEKEQSWQDQTSFSAAIREALANEVKKNVYILTLLVCVVLVCLAL